MFLSLESSILHFLEILVLSYDFYDFGSVQIRAEITLFLIGILHGKDQKRIQIFHDWYFVAFHFGNFFGHSALYQLIKNHSDKGFSGFNDGKYKDFISWNQKKLIWGPLLILRFTSDPYQCKNPIQSSQIEPEMCNRLFIPV